MPLPWKKTDKVSSFSRLVAGLHHSPKRGGSLVVETGFPTSLVDLFVKNKDRLKKPSKKRSPPHSPVQPINFPPPPPPPPPPSPSPSEAADAAPVGLAVSSVSGSKAAGGEIEEIIVGNDSVGVGAGVVEKGAFVGVLKILMVVVVALSTKRIAVGVTMSAFLLLMLEYAGSRVLVFLKPCSKARTVVDSFLVKVKVLSLSIKSKKDVVCLNEIQRCEEGSSNGLDCSDACDSCGLVDEIESKCDEEIQVVDSNCGMETMMKNDFEENEQKCDKKELSRRSKIRRKFVKNFVPKKLRNAKKEWKNKGKEVESHCDCKVGLCCLRDDKLGKGKCPKQEQINEHNETSRFLLEVEEEEKRGCQRQVVFDNGRKSLGTQLQVETKVAQVEEIVEIERKGNSGYIILFLIVLAGLVGGRVLAFVITLAWCLVLKLVGKSKFIPVS